MDRWTASSAVFGDPCHARAAGGAGYRGKRGGAHLVGLVTGIVLSPVGPLGEMGFPPRVRAATTVMIVTLAVIGLMPC